MQYVLRKYSSSAPAVLTARILYPLHTWLDSKLWQLHSGSELRKKDRVIPQLSMTFRKCYSFMSIHFIYSLGCRRHFNPVRRGPEVRILVAWPLGRRLALVLRGGKRRDRDRRLRRLVGLRLLGFAVAAFLSLGHRSLLRRLAVCGRGSGLGRAQKFGAGRRHFADRGLAARHGGPAAVRHEGALLP